MTDSMDAYDRGDFDRLSELYAENVRWLGTEPGRWDCESREDVFSMIRARMSAGVPVDFDEIRASPTHVVLTARVGDSEPVVSVFTVREGRIVHVKDLETREAAEAALV